MPLFDRYMAVDWSARSRPVHGENSIWIATLLQGQEVQFENPRTRHAAMVYIQRQLEQANGRGHRLLCGFDFPFGYPEGTLQRMEGINTWEDLWELIANEIVDQPNNQNNRFDVAGVLNGEFNGDGPFWGNGLHRDIPNLPRTRPRHGWGENLPPERRYCEQEVRGTHTVWQLNGQGSVGSQALMGIARLEAFRQQRNDVQVWPFETLGEGQSHVLAEIYPSLIDPWPGYAVNDQAQVHAVVDRLQQMDQDVLLTDRLRAPEGMPETVQTEEALFIDITN